MSPSLQSVAKQPRVVARAVRKRLKKNPPPLGQPDFSRPYRRLRHFGLARQCPVCGAHLKEFVSLANADRPDAVCPVCSALEWHRFGWWYLSHNHGDRIRSGARVLHVAAEPEIRRQFEAVPGLLYTALDLDPRRASVMADLQKLPFANGSLDLVYCSHVLEHVYDDRVAMAELRRVTKKDGAALIQVPVSADVTWGDPTITDPEERTRLFGLWDHVRRYGPDVVDILGEQGWNVDHVRIEQVPDALVTRHGLPHHEIVKAAFDVFWCTPA